MARIEDILNDPGWQPSKGEPVVTSTVQVPVSTHVLLERITTDVKVAVRALENGLLYAAVIDNNGTPILEQVEQRSYSVENFSRGQSPYQLINLRGQKREGVPGFSATFEYKAGKTPKGLGESIPFGLDEARLEYTTWYNTVYGLTLLTSVQAHQAVKGGWLDVQINSATYGNSDRAMTMEISSLGESLKIDKSGALEKRVPWLSPELKRVYETAIKDAQIDPLRTAVALINGFPPKRPLHIGQLIQYKSPTSIQR